MLWVLQLKNLWNITSVPLSFNLSLKHCRYSLDLNSRRTLLAALSDCLSAFNQTVYENKTAL